MAILLTGGAGKTSRRIAGYLQDAKIPFLMTSRRGQAAAPPGMQAVKFDWLDSSTFEAPFEYQFPNGEKITAVYLVSPETPDPEPSMTSFIDQAVQKYGVKKFVLFTGSSAQPGGPSIGGVWQHLIDIGVEYCVLRATWFMGVLDLLSPCMQDCVWANNVEQTTSPSRAISKPSSTRARSIVPVKMARSRSSAPRTLRLLLSTCSRKTSPTIRIIGSSDPSY